MKTRTMRKAVMPAASLAVLGILLAGCTGGEDQAQPTPTPTSSAVEVSDEELGRALDKLVFHGTGAQSEDGGRCLVEAVQAAEISPEGQAYIIERDSDDIGAVAEGLAEVDEMDAAILLSPELGDEFDACVDAVIPPEDDPQTYESPESTEKPAEESPNLQPKYEIREGQSITSSSELTDGLVSMFSSYALDEEQKQTYVAAGECLSGVVFDAGFSQETLRFLAGGAPIGTGSIADYLPNDEDKAIWESQEFTTALVDCTTNAEPADEETAEA